MPHKREIKDNDLGYRERGKGRARTEKLISDQNNKKEYMVHYRMLKLYVKMGLRLTKIHRVIKFKQDYIRRDYLQNSTNKRATAKTEAEKGWKETDEQLTIWKNVHESSTLRSK